jgi:hypothetical protein
MEYFEPAISAGLSDPSGYVRKTAVMCVCKISENDLGIEGFLAHLEQLVQTDPDSSVVANGIAVLSEKSRISPNKTMVYQLLSRFSQFTEWAKCSIIDNVLVRYFPSDEDELYNLMNVLEPFVKQSSIPVTIGIMKLFLTWASENTDLRLEIMIRFKDPILTLYSSACSSPEMQYGILLEIVSQVSDFYAPHWKTFIVNSNDTDRTAQIKIRILASLATTVTSPIVTELFEYIQYPSLAGDAVSAIVKITSVHAEIFDTVFKNLIDRSSIISPSLPACIIGLRDLHATRYPGIDDLIRNAIYQFLSSDSQDWPEVESGLDAAISILADIDSDDTLVLYEFITDNIWIPDNSRDWTSCQITLISSVIKTFFKFPNIDFQKLLHRIFSIAIDDSTNPDVRDSALFYYRLIVSSSIEDVGKFFSPPNPVLPSETIPTEVVLGDNVSNNSLISF